MFKKIKNKMGLAGLVLALNIINPTEIRADITDVTDLESPMNPSNPFGYSSPYLYMNIGDKENHPVMNRPCSPGNYEERKREMKYILAGVLGMIVLIPVVTLAACQYGNDIKEYIKHIKRVYNQTQN